MKDHPASFVEKIFVLIPNTKIPELDISNLGLNSQSHSQNMNNE